MNGFSKAIQESKIMNDEYGIKYGRPKSELPQDKIRELANKGYSCRGIVKELSKIGIRTSKSTIARILNEGV